MSYRIKLLTPTVEAFGNLGTEIHLGLIWAQRTNSRVALLFVKDFLGPFVFSKGGRGINRALRCVTSPYRFGNERNLGIFIWELVLTLWGFGRIAALMFIARTEGYIPSTPFNALKNFVGVRSYKGPNLNREQIWRTSPKEFTSLEEEIEYWRNAFTTPLAAALPSHISRSCEAVALEMGLSAEEPFVCIHIRETGFYGKTEGPGKLSRNGVVKNYLPAIRLLTNQGYTVVRLGDSSMTPAPPIEGLVDYPFSGEKSDEMDLWLIENCRFFIGGNSGPMEIAKLFQKPIVMTDIFDFLRGYPTKRGDIGILKHFFSIREERFLSTREAIHLQLSEGTGLLRPSSDYLFVENSSDEITDLLIEFLEARKQKECARPSTLQLEVLARRRNLDGLVELSKSPMESASIRVALLGFDGMIGRTFLERNYIQSSLSSKTSGADLLSKLR